jgi:hypothetical protein
MPHAVPVFYSAFALKIRSDRLIPGLIAAPARAAMPDVDIVLGSRPLEAGARSTATEELYYTSADLDERGQPAFRIWRAADGELLRMEYVDGVQFWLDRGGAKIWCTWPENLSIADASVYLLGPVLGLLLRLRGVTCLHASAVAFGTRAVAFAGPAGAGKSTTAAALGRRGHAIISDDILAVRECAGEFLAFPAHPYLGLWPDSVAMLYGTGKKIPEFAPTWEKGRMGLAENKLAFQERSLPLGAIFLLGERADDPVAPWIEEVSSRESLMGLLSNSYGTNLLEKEMRAREFELLGRMVTMVPTWRLRPSTDRHKVEALCALIEKRCGNHGKVYGITSTDGG